CIARWPNVGSRMLCALDQFGICVSAVNSASPPITRSLRSVPRVVLSKRFSSHSSSTSAWPETMTSGLPIMSSQKIGPSSRASRIMSWIGAVVPSDSRLPMNGVLGGCGIGCRGFLAAMFSLPLCGCEPALQPVDHETIQLLGLLLLRPVSALANHVHLQVRAERRHVLRHVGRQRRVPLGGNH